MKTRDQVEREIAAEIGHNNAALALSHARTRLHGLLVRSGPEWDKAYEHILPHIDGDRTGKEVNTLFHKKYRSKEAMRDLLKQVANGPSGFQLTKMKLRGDFNGTPGVALYRQFSESVADRPGFNCLLVILDFQGKLMTAYPIGSLASALPQKGTRQ